MKLTFKTDKVQHNQVEDDLIDGCIRKDYKSQRQLYDQYSDAMYTIAYRMLNDGDEASDVLQEVFIQVFRDIGKFRRESTLGAWIKTITVRSGLRKIKERIKTGYGSIAGFEESEPAAWPSWINSNDLEKAILLLPDGYRVVFLLIEVEGYSHKEVSEMLDMPVGTSKIKLFRAKQQLRKLLNGYN
ncbi:MAG: RNA polymerase sigma factor [Bacteroidota bacterium]